MFNFPRTEKLYSLLIKLDISINFNYSRFIRCIFISSLFFSCRKKRRSKQLMGLFVIRFFYKILRYSNEKREFRIRKYRILILRYWNCSAANINGPKFIFSREYEKYNNDSIIRIHYSKHNDTKSCKNNQITIALYNKRTSTSLKLLFRNF